MSNLQDKIEILKNNVKAYPDFPKTGVLFRDMFSILLNPETAKILKEVLIEVARRVSSNIDVIVGLDARGFLLGPLIAIELGIPFVPIRKKGKLPGAVISQSYAKEYGPDVLQIQRDSIKASQNVLIVDDLLATGGSLAAACKLVEALDAKVAGCLVLIELEGLKGRSNIPADVTAIIKF